MKLALYSDLHLEHHPWYPPESATTADVVILAGDIASHTHGIEWAQQAFVQPVLYVAGNHEYYGAHLGLLDEMRLRAKESVVLLERNSHILNRVRFLGCTLWSNFALNGYGEEMAWAMHSARYGINDFSTIWARGGLLLEPRDITNMHRNAETWLDQELAKPFSGKTVIITHFAPHRGCIDPQYAENQLAPYFVSDLSPLMKKHHIDLWCHGHTHFSTDFVAENGCRVISNQLGYYGEREGTGFRNELLIEI